MFADTDRGGLIATFVLPPSRASTVPLDQNIPVTAITEWVRDPEFVSEEWDQVRPLRARFICASKRLGANRHHTKRAGAMARLGPRLATVVAVE